MGTHFSGFIKLKPVISYGDTNRSSNILMWMDTHLCSRSYFLFTALFHLDFCRALERCLVTLHKAIKLKDIMDSDDIPAWDMNDSSCAAPHFRKCSEINVRKCSLACSNTTVFLIFIGFPLLLEYFLTLFSFVCKIKIPRRLSLVFSLIKAFFYTGPISLSVYQNGNLILVLLSRQRPGTRSGLLWIRVWLMCWV